jgi:hypothetical protein
VEFRSKIEVAKGKPRGNPKKLKPIKKGTHPVGRKPGTPNVVSRALKDALIYAAEHSKHSDDGSLEGYMLTVADDRMAKQRHKQIGVFSDVGSTHGIGHITSSFCASSSARQLGP